ncbi:hypothetical protein L917_18170 [Phytophthora nicotianae]|uniref:Uncharacterized protein n=1 Tax=Phytophthora nicotianae TaxID=4792 RepID=W2FXN7_PHYNI|nr:hypothetical protein L915_18445 [Phytophthora nicotianae]ETL28245.1 hypothetical protein L916_18346 [Phytophthora nicotianae]ETL81499.1 hypothetical protein L917_18170 [Phytophthora nicotianae]
MVLPVSSGLQLKDQFVNLLWEICLESRKTKWKISKSSSHHAEEETACKASVAELFQEIKRLRAENQKFAESQQQLLENQQRLMHKQVELVEIEQRLQSRQDINGRLLCTVYDRQRFPGEHALFNQQTEGTSC